MKVNDKSAMNVQIATAGPVDAAKEAQEVQKVRPLSAGSAGEARATTVTLSDELEEVARIAEAARDTPEVRMDLIEKIRAELQSGEIDGDLDVLAAQLLQELGLDAGRDEE